MNAPLIYKQAAPDWFNTAASKLNSVISPAYRAADKAIGGFKLNNPRFGMPLIGAALGGYGSFRQQSKKVRRGEQEKVNLGSVARSAGLGAGLGLGASYVKPAQKLWHKGFDLRHIPRDKQWNLAENNPIWMRQQTSRPKLFSKDYFREVGEDFAHPAQSFKANLLNNRYVYHPNTDQILRRSIVGEGFMNMQNLIIPGYNAAMTVADKNMSPEEKATRLGASALSALTPKVVPQMIINQIPSFIPFKRKPTPEQIAMAEQLAAEKEAAAYERPPQTV